MTSDLMSNKLNKLSAQRLKLVLLVFCLCWSGLSIYFIAFDKKRTTRVEKIRTIHQPNEQNEYRIDSETIDKIHKYKQYMDSIREPIRPSLLDSMNTLELIYLQQQK